MARYIDADALIEFITKGLNNPDKTKAFGYDAIEILTEIEYAPTADVVPKSETIHMFVKRFESYIGNCTFTMGQYNDIQYAIKKATEDIIGDA